MKRILLLSFFFISITITTNGQISKGAVKEVTCPCIVEYSFPASMNSYQQVSGGIPVLRLSKAEVSDNKLVCVYERSFAVTANIHQATGVYKKDDESIYIDGGFAFWRDGNVTYPNSITFTLANKDKYLTDWKSMGQVKVDVICKTKVNLSATDNMQWDGVIYGLTLQNSSNPDLFQEFSGFAKVNDKGTGFLVSSNVYDLYGGNTPAVAPQSTDKKSIKKPLIPKKIIRK